MPVSLRALSSHSEEHWAPQLTEIHWDEETRVTHLPPLPVCSAATPRLGSPAVNQASSGVGSPALCLSQRFLAVWCGAGHAQLQASVSSSVAGVPPGNASGDLCGHLVLLCPSWGQGCPTAL